MRERLTVSGAAAVTTTTSASAIAVGADDADRAGGARGDHLLEVHLVRAAIPECPSTSPTSYGSGRSSRLNASEEPTPPPPPTIAIRAVTPRV